MAVVDRKPDIAIDEVSTWCREHYALAGRFQPLPGERDLNFKVFAETGGTFVCKICDGTEDLAFLAAQHEAMAHLNCFNLSAIPKVLVSNGQKTLVAVEGEDGRTYVLRVLTYVPGQVLATCAPYSRGLLGDFGRTMGRLAAALAGFDHPAFHYDFHWDLVHGAEVVERYGPLVDDKSLRAQVDRIHEEFRNIVFPRLEELRKSVIHNDANDYNILAEGEEVTGIIDFGDMVYSCTICDLAIAMAYAVLDGGDPMQRILEMTGGYHEMMPIEEEEWTVLFPMMRMRLAVSACMAAHQMSLRPDDAYLAISQEPIRKTLPALMSLETEEVEHLLRKAFS